MLHLGVDVGTTAVKAAVFDTDGTCISVASKETETVSPHTGWSEQDMEAVWDNVRHAVSSAASGCAADKIVSVGVAGQGDGLWAMDASLRPARNAILWNDQRASSIVQHWIQSGVSSELAKICRTVIWPGASAPLYAWLKRHEPDTVENIAHICNAKDWIGFRLTGKLKTDFTDGSIPFLDLNKRQYSEEAFALCGVKDLSGKVLPPRLSSELLGVLTSQAAEDLGLKQGLPVAVGALDVAAMHIGAGLNTVGESLLILGTTAVVSSVLEPSSQPEHPIGATVIHPYGDRWLYVQGPQSGASAVDWLANLHPEIWPGGAQDVVKSAEKSPLNSNGIIFLPYLTGERAPFVAPDASGVFIGLRPETSKSDLARAVLEGVAFSLRHCVDEAATVSRKGFVVAGGGARSELWRQILAEVLGSPVRLAADDIGIRGAALLGGAALGAGEPPAAQASDDPQPPCLPDADNTKTYDAGYKRFREYVDALMPIWTS
ncbi:MAG: FGGY-family carbohydrate kinase [Stappiaceae bacterium]